MATNGPTYYEVLGISPVASPDEIKKRYRELARVHHPDVAKAPNAAETFKKINEANGVLSDPVRRSLYDSELALKSHRQAPSNPFETPASHFKPGPSSAAPSSANKSNQQRRAPDNDFKKVVLEAQQAYSKMRYREAEQLAREALRMYRRDPAVYELLGDIEVKRSRIDEAVAYYSYALQLDRMRPGLQRKFDKLTGTPSGATMSGSAAKAARHTVPLRSDRTFYTSSSGKFGLVVFMFLGFVGFVTCCWLFYYLVSSR